MENKDPLMEAARKGDIEFLLKSIDSNPTLLEVIIINNNQETPLHVASIYGHLPFIKEILKLNKNLGKELNKDGFTPLHIAASMGHVEVVKELINKLSGEICLIKGKQRKIPLHYAAMRGRVSVIDELVNANPETLENVSVFGETVLHLAVRFCRFDGFVVLLERLKEFDKMMMFVLNKQDHGGNTVLHLAVEKRQLEVIELLLGSNNTIPKDSIEVNSLNSNGLTPLDLLLHTRTEPEDIEIHQILTKSGAIRSIDHQNTTQVENNTTTTSQESLMMTHKQWLDYLKNKKEKVSPNDIRNILLVIAILIATATYQAALNPPGGVWQEDICVNGYCIETNIKLNKTKVVYYAGTTIMGSKNWISYGIFIFLNSLGFFTSIELISLLTKGLPFYLELQVSLTAIALTYGFGMAALSPSVGLAWFFLVISVVLPVAAAKIPSLIRKIAKKTRISPLRSSSSSS